MSVMETFNPAYKRGVTISATTTTSNAAVGAGMQSLVLTNLGSATVYICCGVSGVTATEADYPLLAGAQVSITKAIYNTHVAALAASGTVSVHVIPGEGF
jgi:hypothetical protein